MHCLISYELLYRRDERSRLVANVKNSGFVTRIFVGQSVFLSRSRLIPTFLASDICVRLSQSRDFSLVMLRGISDDYRPWKIIGWASWIRSDWEKAVILSENETRGEDRMRELRAPVDISHINIDVALWIPWLSFRAACTRNDENEKKKARRCALRGIKTESMEVS